jgi:hypothetical protein
MFFFNVFLEEDSDVEMNEGSFTKEEEMATSDTDSKRSSLKIGDKVMVDWQDVDSKWHPGIVVGMGVEGSYLVEFNSTRYCVKKNRIYISPR